MRSTYNKDDLVFIAKGQIIRDMSQGEIPRSATSFGGLHDFVDANEYGGFCDGPVCEALDKQFPRTEADDMNEGLMDLVNAVQDKLACWLSEGGAHPVVAVKDAQQLAYMLRAGEPDRESVILSALHRFTPQQILAACAEELVPNEVRLLAVM